jgi:hypothetical protein
MTPRHSRDRPEVAGVMLRHSGQMLVPIQEEGADIGYGLVVLVDHAAEHAPTPHRRGQRHDDHLAMIGWPLLPGLRRPVPVIAPGAGPQHCLQIRSHRANAAARADQMESGSDRREH